MEEFQIGIFRFADTNYQQILTYAIIIIGALLMITSVHCAGLPHRAWPDFMVEYACAEVPLKNDEDRRQDARSHRHGTSSHDDSDGLSTSSTSTRRVSRRRSFFTASSASPTARRSVRLLHDQNRNVVESIRMTIVNMMTEIYAGMTSLLSQHHQNTVEAEMLKNIQDPSFSIKYLLHLELSKSCYDDLLEDENVARELDEIFRDEEVAKGFLAYIGRNKVDYLKKLLKDRK